VAERKYLSRFLRLVERAVEPPLLLAVVTRNIYYPCQLVLSDGSGGIQGVYWHPGVLYVVETVDIDGDGNEEILVAGTNNSVARAAWAVLDPDDLWGQAPPFDDFEGVDAARHRAYITFPSTPWVQDELRNAIETVQLSGPTGYRAVVLEGKHPTFPSLRPTVIYHFNRVHGTLAWTARQPGGDLQIVVAPSVPANRRYQAAADWLRREVSRPCAWNGRKWIPLGIGAIPPEFGPEDCDADARPLLAAPGL